MHGFDVPEPAREPPCPAFPRGFTPDAWYRHNARAAADWRSVADGADTRPQEGETPWSIFSILINLLGSHAKTWNYEGERLLRASDVDYTIVRPGGDPASNDHLSTHAEAARPLLDARRGLACPPRRAHWP